MDDQVVDLAIQQNRIILTFDLDFGSLYHEADAQARFGCIILRLHDQRIESVNQLLSRFFQSEIGSEVFQDSSRALVVLTESGMRVVN